jgi:hypothetical protein
MRITSAEARKVADSLKPAASEYVEAAYQEVLRAANKGWLSTQLEWAWNKMGSPSREVRNQVINVLRTDGYSVEWKDDPDPGSIHSRGPYHRVSW